MLLQLQFRSTDLGAGVLGKAFDELHLQDLVGCPGHLADNKAKKKSIEECPALFFTYIPKKLVSVRIEMGFPVAKGFLLKGVK